MILLKEQNNIKKGFGMKMYLKLMLNKLKIMENSIFIYTHWAYSSRKLPIYM